MTWDLIDAALSVYIGIMMFYYMRRADKMEARLRMAEQRLFDETVDRMNDEDN